VQKIGDTWTKCVVEWFNSASFSMVGEALQFAHSFLGKKTVARMLLDLASCGEYAMLVSGTQPPLNSLMKVQL